MILNTQKIKKTIREKGFFMEGYARSRGFSHSTFRHVINNRYPYPESGLVKKIKSQLKKDGFLFYEN